uniref:proteasome accessory factor PafA2 family protein n=1 Tax=Dietzia sp. TaxID=1871616 RepID=UPI002FD88A3E
IGDANMSELATFLKIGTTSLVLDAIESGVRFADLQALDPPSAVGVISHDTGLKRAIHLADGRELTALEIQREILARVRAHAEGNASTPNWAAEVLDEWEAILDALATDPLSCADRLDWPAKLALLDGLRRRDGLEWDDPKLAALDIQYSDIDPERGLYNRLAARGRIRRLVDEEDVRSAVINPPENTRAWLRGEAIGTLGERIFAAGWDQLTIIDDAGDPRLVAMPDPYAGTRTETEERPELLSLSPSAPTHVVAGDRAASRGASG